MKVNRAPNGLCYLHIWRMGTAFEGSRGHLLRAEWTNIRFALQPHLRIPNVRTHDLRRKLPLPDDCFDAVYANHVIEHLSPAEGERFTAELWRVLKPGGICRMVTPDLESVCLEYLQRLRTAADNPSDNNLHCYQLALLNLIDQMVRDVPGGLMLPILLSRQFDVEYVRTLWGDVFDRYYPEAPRLSLRQKIASHSPKELFFIALRRLQLFVRGNDPRRIAETTRWMYDRLSLPLLLQKSRFRDVVVRDYATSDIPDWSRYDFDRSTKGDFPFEPSIYVEGRKR